MYPTELQQIIRFNISQLSATNGQAEFEKICLFFSRSRINKNILPAPAYRVVFNMYVIDGFTH
jgi:hypothetical protein